MKQNIFICVQKNNNEIVRNTIHFILRRASYRGFGFFALAVRYCYMIHLCNFTNKKIKLMYNNKIAWIIFDFLQK